MNGQTKCGMAGQMDYHPASSRKEILTHTATWMNLEDRLLNGLSQRQKDEYGRVPPNVRYLEWSKPESRIVVAEGEGRRGVGNYCVMVAEFQFGQVRKFWRRPAGGDSCTAL